MIRTNYQNETLEYIRKNINDVMDECIGKQNTQQLLISIKNTIRTFLIQRLEYSDQSYIKFEIDSDFSWSRLAISPKNLFTGMLVQFNKEIDPRLTEYEDKKGKYYYSDAGGFTFFPKIEAQSIAVTFDVTV